MLQFNETSLVKIMAGVLFGVKSLSDLMLACYLELCE